MPKAFLQIKLWYIFDIYQISGVENCSINRFHFRIHPFFKYWDDSAGFPKNYQLIFIIQKFR